eukprot:scaffold70628_cov71-Phaeocystis_antarctica.AAC.3
MAHDARQVQVRVVLCMPDHVSAGPSARRAGEPQHARPKWADVFAHGGRRVQHHNVTVLSCLLRHTIVALRTHHELGDERLVRKREPRLTDGVPVHQVGCVGEDAKHAQQASSVLGLGGAAARLRHRLP